MSQERIKHIAKIANEAGWYVDGKLKNIALAAGSDYPEMKLYFEYDNGVTLVVQILFEDTGFMKEEIRHRLTLYSNGFSSGSEKDREAISGIRHWIDTVCCGSVEVILDQDLAQLVTKDCQRHIQWLCNEIKTLSFQGEIWQIPAITDKIKKTARMHDLVFIMAEDRIEDVPGLVPETVARIRTGTKNACAAMEKTLDEVLHMLYEHTGIRETSHSILATSDAEIHILIHYGGSHAVLKLKFAEPGERPSLMMFPGSIECLPTMMPDDMRRNKINNAASSMDSFMKSWRHAGYAVTLPLGDASKAITACLPKMKELNEKLVNAHPDDDDLVRRLCGQIGRETAMVQLLKDMEAEGIRGRN